MGKAHWASDWKVGVRVWVEREGQAVLAEGRAELLAAIDTEHSITRAAKAAGMSYRRAWNLIQEVNEAAGEPLVAAAVGGKEGGGARLTENGRLALAVYEDVRRSLIESAGTALERVLRPKESAANCVHLSAAISLQESIGQVLAEYALSQPTVRVRTIFGASNELADQLLAGAPCDVFVSADPVQLSRLVDANRVAKNAHQTIAKNGLAIVGGAKSAPISKASDLLEARFKRVAIAEADCPLGQYSKAYLEKTRLYEKLQSKALYVDNSRAVLAAVVSNAAQAGVAFSSDASTKGAWKSLLTVPVSQAATTYVAAIIGRGSEREESKSLYDFLSSRAAARCYRRCGLKTV